VPSYLIETYLARGRAGERAQREQRARSAAEQTGVRFERSIYVPEDEICFFIVDAPSSRHAALIAERAGLEPVRIVEASPSEQEA
jgi:hypothetical protein